MSYQQRSRQAKFSVQRLAPKPFHNAGQTDHLDREPVAINGYNPLREIAARQVGADYGQVYVAGCIETTRSYELNEHGNGASFLTSKHLRDERDIARVTYADRDES